MAAGLVCRWCKHCAFDLLFDHLLTTFLKLHLDDGCVFLVQIRAIELIIANGLILYGLLTDDTSLASLAESWGAVARLLELDFLYRLLSCDTSLCLLV